MDDIYQYKLKHRMAAAPSSAGVRDGSNITEVIECKTRGGVTYFDIAHVRQNTVAQTYDGNPHAGNHTNSQHVHHENNGLSASPDEADKIQKSKIKRMMFGYKNTRYNFVQVLAVGVIISGFYLTYLSLTVNNKIDVQVEALEQKSAALSNDGATTADDGTIPADTPPPSAESVYSYTRPADLPKRLEINKINVLAKIIDIGLDKKGNISVPISLHDVGWFTGSSNPAMSPGSTVLAGHVGGAKNDGVFYNLTNIKSGDIVTVVMGNESKISYKVTSVESVPVKNVQMSKYLSYAGQTKATLHLITCSGSFNTSSLSYNNRLIVSTEKL